MRKFDKERTNKGQNVNQSQEEGNKQKQPFVDNRPEAIRQRKIQEAANNSPYVQRLKSFQEAANNSPQVRQAKYWSDVMNGRTKERDKTKTNTNKKTGSVIIENAAALAAIKNTLPSSDGEFVVLDAEGKINSATLNLNTGSKSGNFAALKALVNGETEYTFSVSSSYISADTDEPQVLVGDDENGTKGVTLFPNAEIDRSPDGRVHVYVSDRLSEGRQAEVMAHEGFGHAYFYEKQTQGEDINPNHQYESTLIEVNPEAESMMERYAFGRKDVNTDLVNQIDQSEKEAVLNYESRKKKE